MHYSPTDTLTRECTCSEESPMVTRKRQPAKIVSGLDEIKQAQEAHIRELGLTKQEYLRRHRLRLQMDVMLQIGASRDP